MALEQTIQGNLVDPLVMPATDLPAASEFEQLVELYHGTLEAREGIASEFEFRLTLKNVQPSRMQEQLEALVMEINSRFRTLNNHPSSDFKVYLSKNRDLPDYEEAGDVVFTCTSLIHDSTNRHRTNTITRNDGERTSQEALLSEYDLVEVPNDVVRAVAGMYRIAQGFPDDMDVIGTEGDNGDMFKGKVARTKRGPSSGCAASSKDGIDGRRWVHDWDPAMSVGYVGGHPPELKQFAR